MHDPATAVGQRTRLARSHNTERALEGPRPRLRGRFHLVAAVLGVPAAALAMGTAPAGSTRVAVAAFAWGIAVMLGCSALLHLRRWPATTHEVLLRLDHSGIYLAIGGTGVALGLLGLDGLPSRLLVTLAVAGVVVGVLVEWLPFATPRGVAHASYLVFGWLPIALLPWLWSSAGPTTVTLLLGGGLLYTLGAVIVALRRPDPLPHVFGYHELFHLLVLAAATAHGIMVADLVLRAA